MFLNPWGATKNMYARPRRAFFFALFHTSSDFRDQFNYSAMNELVGVTNLRVMEIVVRGGAATCEGSQPKSGVRMGVQFR
jgi:hypothetical protein